MNELRLNGFYFKKNDFKFDSRGNVLSPYDYVLFTNIYAGYANIFSTTLDDGCGLTNLIHRTYCLGNVYNFKLTEEEYVGMRELAKSIVPDNSYDFEKDRFNSILEKREELYKEKYKKNTIRGLEMIEITGKQLNIGDLVIYFKDDNISYGVVYSSTKLVLSDLSTLTVRAVYKPLSLSVEETCLRNSIQEYMMKSRTVNLKKFDTIERGMVFSSKDNIYVYFGLCNINEYYSGITKYKIEFKFPNDKELYLKLPISCLDSLMNTPDEIFNQKYQSGVIWPSRTIRKNLIIDNYLEVTYMSIAEIDMFVDKVEKNLKYWGKIDLPNTICWTNNIYFNIEFLN